MKIEEINDGNNNNSIDYNVINNNNSEININKNNGNNEMNKNVEININENNDNNKNEENKEDNHSLENSSNTIKWKKSNMKKYLKIAITSLFLMIIIFILWNGISAHKEKNFLQNIDYGKKIDVNGHNMSVDIIGDTNNQTIVILPGLGAASPILQFKPIAEALSDVFRMVIIEPFGYGFSDFEIEKERITKEITSELHACLEQLHLDSFYLMAHSMSGIYSLKFSNDYPSKVLGFIGLDATVPTEEELKPNYFSSEEKIVAMKPLFDTLGISRLYSYINPTFNIEIDPSYKYTESEIEIFKFLNRNKSYNKLILNELQHYSDNVNEMQNMAFPENIPVLNFVASETITEDPYWMGDHYREISEKHKSKVITLKGSHYIHLDQKEAIVQKIKEWIN